MTRSTPPPVVVITGASAGVGRAVVRVFAKQGACIGLLARGAAGLEGARRDASDLGGWALALPTDVSDADQVEAAASAVEREFGPITIWINAAMCSVFSPVREMTPADFKRVTEVTYLGFVYGTLAALKRMLPRDKGMIIQVGSALAYRGIPLQAAYCGGKHAIQGFTESLRCELIHDQSKVQITMVQMPALNTPQFDWVKNHLPRRPQPVPPIYQPEVAANAIYHAAYNYRREWLVGASTVTAVQGNKVAPGFGDWYLAQQGYQSQQGPELADPSRPSNLYEPVDAEKDFGAHGDFDKRAHPSSPLLWLDQQRRWIGAAGFAGAIYEALRSGTSKSWRGGLIGVSLGTLGLAVVGRFSRWGACSRLPSQR